MDARFLGLADHYFDEYMRKIRDCVAVLSEEQAWWRPNEACNSVANLLLHLRGNLSQWVLATLGGRPFQRQRAEEFRAREGPSKEALLAGLEEVVREARSVIGALSAADLQRPCRVQGHDTHGLGVVLHAVEHMSYHTGQIAFVAKQLGGPAAGIEFYPQHRGE